MNDTSNPDATQDGKSLEGEFYFEVRNFITMCNSQKNPVDFCQFTVQYSYDAINNTDNNTDNIQKAILNYYISLEAYRRFTVPEYKVKVLK